MCFRVFQLKQYHHFLFNLFLGPSVLDVFNTLLRHLRLSVDSAPADGPRANDERHFQESIINTIGEFASGVWEFEVDIQVNRVLCVNEVECNPHLVICK